ncbi:hypothetical protein GCM10023189_03650 [Nibrella saemangeumensis]|uniref:Uncharacterized protein n=2 Tax=Nibrella saemangeumensis TaxID=1084526 RepID=A0ABP8MBX9_9BACT
MFNGYLLYRQSRQRSLNEYELYNTANLLNPAAYQQQLSECIRANEQKDSLLRRLEQAPNAPPGKAVAVQHSAAP